MSSKDQPSFDFDKAATGIPWAVDDICRNRHGGNPESEAANLKTRKERDTERVIAFYRECDMNGATCEEVSIALRMRYTTASARISELKRLNQLSQIGRRNTSTGSPAAVLVLAELLEAQQ